MPEPKAFEFEMAVEKLKRHKSPCIDQVPSELIKAVGRTVHSEIHKLTEELPEEWKESIILPVYEKGVETECNNFRGISLLSTTYKILSNILLSRLISYAEAIVGDPHR